VRRRSTSFLVRFFATGCAPLEFNDGLPREHMLQDYKLGLRMLLKYPGLTLAGGLALAIAIGIGAGWFDLMGKILAPRIPLPKAIASS